LKLLLKIFLILFVLIIIASILGYIYQHNADISDNEKYPARGKLVKTSLGETHINTQGTGDLTVVFESGQGDCSLEWFKIQPEIAKFARVCSYDRPGLGWSSPSTKIINSQEIAENLFQTLKAANTTGPYILAGHSVGGIYIRKFVQLYPNEVAGLLFIDSSHENQKYRLPEKMSEENESMKSFASFFKLLVPFGIPRVLDLADKMQGDYFDEEIRPAAMSRLYQTHFFDALYNEIESTELSISQVAPPDSLGDLPLIVLSQGGNNPGLPQEEFEQLKNIWNELQLDLLSLSSNNRHIIAENSGHYIQNDQPEIIIDAISQLIEMVKNKKNNNIKSIE